MTAPGAPLTMQTDKTRPIAYLTSEHPKFSHTFIQREIAALRAKGEAILTCATRRPPEEALTGPEERAEYERTFAIMERARNPLRLIGDIAVVKLTRFGGVLSALKLAFTERAPGLRGLIYAFIYLTEAMVLARRLRRENARRLHVHFANAACTVGMLAARILGVPYSFTLHGPSDFLDVETSRLAAKLSRAEFVACISGYARGRAMAHLPEAAHAKLHIIHCGVQPARYADAPPPTGKGLLFVGRLAEVKGVPLLLEAFRRLRPGHPDATLTIVGDGELRQALEGEAEGVDNVRFTGAIGQADVAAELARSAIFILPSFAEGVPVVLMEAMAAGRPVVATRITGVPELVEDGVSGVLIEPGDVEALTAAIEGLLRDSEKAARFGEAGRAKVAADFDIEGEAGRLRTLFAAYDAATSPGYVRR